MLHTIFIVVGILIILAALGGAGYAAYLLISNRLNEG